jgi:hypothetical protein
MTHVKCLIAEQIIAERPLPCIGEKNMAKRLLCVFQPGKAALSGSANVMFMIHACHIFTIFIQLSACSFGWWLIAGADLF